MRGEKTGEKSMHPSGEHGGVLSRADLRGHGLDIEGDGGGNGGSREMMGEGEAHMCTVRWGNKRNRGTRTSEQKVQQGMVVCAWGE